jgi:anaerobic selenocysteine-containing dehydrogenase
MTVLTTVMSTFSATQAFAGSSAALASSSDSHAAQRAFGLLHQPFARVGPARFEFVVGSGFLRRRADRPGACLVNFGSNLVMAHGDTARGHDALAALDFFVHADLFMCPTAELADIVVPVSSPFEAEALRIGFESSQAAQSLVQLRTPLSAPWGQARSDLQIIFALAVRLGLARNSSAATSRPHSATSSLAPSGITLEQLRTSPAFASSALRGISGTSAAPPAP